MVLLNFFRFFNVIGSQMQKRVKEFKDFNMTLLSLMCLKAVKHYGPITLRKLSKKLCISQSATNNAISFLSDASFLDVRESVEKSKMKYKVLISEEGNKFLSSDVVKGMEKDMSDRLEQAWSKAKADETLMRCRIQYEDKYNFDIYPVGSISYFSNIGARVCEIFDKEV